MASVNAGCWNMRRFAESMSRMLGAYRRLFSDDGDAAFDFVVAARIAAGGGEDKDGRGCA